MGRFTSFEVQVFQGGRWSIHAQYASHQREAAINEAKKIERTPGFDAVKVVKEVFDSSEGVHHDFLVYRGPKEFKEHKGFRDIGDGAGESDDEWSSSGWKDEIEWGKIPEWEDGLDEDGDDSDHRKPVRPQSATVSNVIVRMCLVALSSLTVAAIFTYAFSWWFSGERVFGVKLVGNAEANALFIVFVVSFLLTASSLAYNRLRNVRIKASQQPPRHPASGPARTHAGSGAVPARPQPDMAPSSTRQEDEGTIGDWRNHENPETEAERTARAAKEAEDVNERLREQLHGKARIDDGDDEDHQAAPEGAAPSGLDATGEKQKTFMMSFLNTIMEAAGGDKKKLDNFTKFGINLFLAGACESLAEARSMNTSVRARILADSVQVLGFKKSHAGNFAVRYEEYLLQDSRYMSMFQAGRNAMKGHMADDGSARSHLASALKDWAKPKPKQEQASVVAVMFTDICGSTALTQRLGDAGAQEVVRAHNKIVREALTQFTGREVKHTGDGMMCSFAQPTNAVEAAVTIQRNVQRFAQANPDKPLRLKIGINAGEPIAEENDLFGTTVQLAARLVDEANQDEIFISDTVRGICTGKGFNFSNKGNYELKGFGDAITVYEVLWQPEVAKAS